MTNLTPEIKIIDNNIYFGNVKKGTEKIAKILFENKTLQSKAVSCGSCTKLETTQKGEDVEATIKYKALTLGEFNKTATLTFTDGQKISFQITGKGV